MSTPELITEPPASIDVTCSHMDLASVVQAHRDRGYRPASLDVGRTSYRITFSRIKQTTHVVITQTGGKA